LDGVVLEKFYSCLGAWIQDFECYDAKRGIAGISVVNANYGVFGQALFIHNMNNTAFSLGFVNSLII